MLLLGAWGVLAALLAIPVSRARADAFDVYGCGARGMGMANSLLTVADDPCAFYYNPALVPMISHYFTVGYTVVADELYIELDNPRTNPSSDIPNTHGVMVGFASSLGIPNFRLGALIYSPVNRLQLQHSFFSDKTEYYLTNRLYFSLIGDVTQAQTIIIGGGYQPFESLSVGLGFLVTIVTDLVENLYMPDLMSPDELYINMNSSQSNEIAPIVGFYLRFSPSIRFGFSYRGETAYPIRGEGLLKAKLGGIDYPPGDDNFLVQVIDAYTFYTPDKLSGSCGVNVFSDVVLEFGLDWMRWSRYRDTHYQRLDEPEEFYTEESHTRDTANIRAGVEKSDERDRRFWAGLMYVPTPIPEQNQGKNFVDNDRIAVSMGIGYPLTFAGKTLRGDLSCQWQHLMRREVEKAEPFPVEFDADPSTEEIDNPGYPGYASGGNLITVKITMNYHF